MFSQLAVGVTTHIWYSSSTGSLVFLGELSAVVLSDENELGFTEGARTATNDDASVDDAKFPRSRPSGNSASTDVVSS